MPAYPVDHDHYVNGLSLGRLTEELKNESSRVLFLLSTANDPSVPGNSPGGPGDDAKAGGAQDDSQQVHRVVSLSCSGSVYGTRLPKVDAIGVG